MTIIDNDIFFQKDTSEDKKIITTFQSIVNDKTQKKYIKASLVSSEIIDDKINKIMSQEVYYPLFEEF